MEAIVETRASSILEFIGGIRGELNIRFEEGVCAEWLYGVLKSHAHKIVVCDPRKNALLKAGNKNDRIDARKLAELLRSKNRMRSRSRLNGYISDPRVG